MKKAKVKLTGHSKKKFEEFYFKGYYSGIGDFSSKRDRELRNWFLAMFNFINKTYPVKKGSGKKAIEFGCATGVAAGLLRDYGYQVTATDVSELAVRKAKKNHKGIDFRVHDMQKSIGRKSYFDIAVAFDVIEHLKKPEEAFKQVYSMLRKNGVILFSTPNDYPYVYNDPTHISVKKPEVWARIAKKAGFKNIYMKQVTFIPFLYRYHWRLNYALPFPIVSQYFNSPVFIIARK